MQISAKRTKKSQENSAFRDTKQLVLRILLYVILALLSVLFLFPILWIMISAFKPAGELFAWPPTLLPQNPTITNFSDAMARGDFLQYFGNTTFSTLVATAFTVVINVMSGYVFAKYRFRFQTALFAMVLATLMVPLEVIMIPIFQVIVATNLFNSLWGIIIPAVASPTSVFLVRQYYQTIPDEFMEAARIDGASEFRIFLQVMLPIAKPIIAVLCIISFMWRWNDFLWPMLVIQSRHLYTIQLALANYSGEFNVDWNSLLAMSSISMVPVIVVFVALQKHIIGGMISGGVKG
ncbi:MAG: carbohydrate ABC transporter permease [Defluviitaleaceae bacterium]|nr:carbohydrate ABC transporter permease [Defluviitaleaceae bacterium]